MPQSKMNASRPSAKDAVRHAQDKIRTLVDIAEIARQEQAAGRKVVLAHGVFDLVHMGHIRHLEAARREGDILVVTLTADRYVNKGPGRPIFAAEIRAEMIAAIEYVDWVAVNEAETSEPILRSIRPDVYVKGADYENPDDDITGGITAEREAVEHHGGRLVFTKDITFSSSSLINRYLGVYDRPLQDYLESLRGTGASERIFELIESVKKTRVLLIGDAIVDEYLYVTAMGKSAKESIIATKFSEREIFAGGVFAAANHIANLCAEVEVVTVLGGDDDHEDLIRANLKPNVRLTALSRPNAPTTRKSRFVDAGYMRKLFEVYFFDDTPLADDLQGELNHLISTRASEFDVVIVSDFGHGLIGPSTIETLSRSARFLAASTQTNSANIGYNLVTKYKRADYVCIDAPEAHLASGDKFASIESIVSEKLADQIACDRMIVTHGRQGCVAFQRGMPPHRIPAFTKTVVDTMGAGDAFLAVTAPLVAAGGRMEDVAFVGNAAGAMKVNIVGHRHAIEKVALLKYIATLLK